MERAGWARVLTIPWLVVGCTLSTDGAVGGNAPHGGVGAGGAESSSASTQGSGGAGATGASGTGGGAEDCTNGVDDDANGKKDCDDASCSDHTCVDAAPGAQYVLVDAGAGCPPGWAAATHWDCETCDCEAPCTVEVELFQDHECTVGGLTVALPPDGMCVDHADVFTADIQTTKVGLIAKLAEGATVCALTGPTASKLCVAESVGACADGKACVPPGGPPTCVLTDADCPAGWNGSTDDLHGGPDATACGCSCSGTAECPTEMTHFRDEDGCGGHGHDRPLNGACVDTTDGEVRSSRAIPSGDPSCDVAAAPSSPVSHLCCK